MAQSSVKNQNSQRFLKASSKFECLSTEVLQGIFLFSLNPNLALTSPFLNATLSNDYVYNLLCLIAFGRGACVTPACYYYFPDRYCSFCRAWNANSNEGWSHDSHDPSMCGDLEAAHEDKQVVEDPLADNGIAHGWDKMDMTHKRSLQDVIIRSRWFSLRHVLKVERECDAFPSFISAAWESPSEDPDIQDGDELDLDWGQHHHRRHILHGVGLPPRLPSGPLSGDDHKMLYKLIEWTADCQWSYNACAQVKEKTLTAATEGMKCAISLGQIDLMELYGGRRRNYRRLGVKSTTEMLGILVTNRPYSKKLICTFWRMFWLDHIVAGDWFDDDYRAALEYARKLKMEGDEDGRFLHWLLTPVTTEQQSRERPESLLKLTVENGAAFQDQGTNDDPDSSRFVVEFSHHEADEESHIAPDEAILRRAVSKESIELQCGLSTIGDDRWHGQH